MARTPSRRYLLNLALFTLVALLLTLPLLVVALCYRAAYVYTHPVRSLPVRTPADAGLSYESVELRTEDGLHIAAWYVPAAQVSAPALVLVHGIGANRGDLVGLGRDLAARGNALLLLDLRAHGESEGSISTLGLHEVREIRAAVEYLRGRPDVDPERIGVLGVSLGASTALMAAAEVPAIKAVVADSAFASVEWLARNQFDAFFDLPDWVAPAVLRAGAWQAGVDPALVSPMERMPRIAPRPVLLIHGEQDTLFRVDNFHLLVGAATHPIDAWLVPGVGHVGAYGHDPPAYVDRVQRLFEAAFAAPGTSDELAPLAMRAGGGA